MNNKTAVFCALFCVSKIASAQMVYDINEYKNRVNSYRYKNFYWNGNNEGFLNGGKFSYNNPVNNSGYINSTASSSFNLGNNYYKYVNTETLQQVISSYNYIAYSMSSSHLKTAGFSDNYKSVQFLLSPNFSILQRKYKQSKFNYLAFDINLPIRFNGYKNDQSIYQNVRNTSVQPNINFSYGFGKGRLEMISDASFATFWLNDLKAKNVLNEISAQQIQQLATMITRVRNTRIIDFRFRAIDQIKMYDSFFQHSGFVSKPDAVYYSTLYDHYLYANNYLRFSGIRKTYFAKVFTNQNLSGSYTRMQNNYTINSRTLNGDLNLGFGMNFENNKALNLKKQKNSFTEILLYYNLNHFDTRSRYADSNTYSTSSHSKNTGIQFLISRTWEKGFYFNTRSYLNFSTQLQMQVAFTDYKNQTIMPGIKFFSDYYYWFSPNFQAAFHAGINCTPGIVHQNETPTMNAYKYGFIRVNPYFNFSLNYVVF
jgi:hypothetical protein